MSAGRAGQVYRTWAADGNIQNRRQDGNREKHICLSLIHIWHPDHIDSEFEAFARARHAVIRGYDWVPSVPNPWLLVNATPVGMYPHMGVSPVPAEITARFPKVVDIIYNPAETQLLKDARGDRINGMYMLVMQAVAAEEIWMDRDISEDTVQAIVKEMMS